MVEQGVELQTLHLQFVRGCQKYLDCLHCRNCFSRITFVASTNLINSAQTTKLRRWPTYIHLSEKKFTASLSYIVGRVHIFVDITDTGFSQHIK